MSVCHSALVCFSVAVAKSNLGKERVNFSSLFQVTGGLHQGRNSSRNQSRNHGGKQLSGSLFLYSPGPLLGNGTALGELDSPHQSPIKAVQRHCSGLFDLCCPSVKIPLSQVSLNQADNKNEPGQLVFEHGTFRR